MLIKQLEAQGTATRWCLLVEFSLQTKVMNSIKMVFELKKTQHKEKPNQNNNLRRDFFGWRLFSFLWKCWQMPLIKCKQEFLQAFPLWIIFELLMWASPSKRSAMLRNQIHEVQMERPTLSICLGFMDEWFILMCPRYSWIFPSLYNPDEFTQFKFLSAAIDLPSPSTPSLQAQAEKRLWHYDVIMQGSRCPSCPVYESDLCLEGWRQ